MGVTLSDFQPVNHWQPDRGQTEFLIDQTTNRRYFNESKKEVGFKCFLLTLSTPFVHTIVSIINVVYRILRLVTLFHFWIDDDGDDNYETKYFFKERLAAAGKDILKIVATPVSIVGLELAALYGWFRPYDGRKLYASIERATYDDSILAPCFQPEFK